MKVWISHFMGDKNKAFCSPYLREHWQCHCSVASICQTSWSLYNPSKALCHLSPCSTSSFPSVPFHSAAPFLPSLFLANMSTFCFFLHQCRYFLFSVRHLSHFHSSALDPLTALFVLPNDEDMKVTRIVYYTDAHLYPPISHLSTAATYLSALFFFTVMKDYFKSRNIAGIVKNPLSRVEQYISVFLSSAREWILIRDAVGPICDRMHTAAQSRSVGGEISAAAGRGRRAGSGEGSEGEKVKQWLDSQMASNLDGRMRGCEKERRQLIETR